MSKDPITNSGYAWGEPTVEYMTSPASAVGANSDVRYKMALLNERETTHGDWNKTAATAQAIKALWEGNPELSASQREALDMIATKIARIVCGNADEPDHWKDVAGYATLVAENLDAKP